MPYLNELQTTIRSKKSGKRRTIKVEQIGTHFAYVGSVHAGGHQLGETDGYSFPYAAWNQARDLLHTL